MTFTVIWTEDAEDELAQTWLNSGDRKSVTAASLAIDELLQRSADSAGESRGGTLRIVFMSPLAAVVDVRIEDARAFVIGVWSTARPE